MLGTLRQRLVSKDFENFAQTKCKLPSAPTDLLWVMWPLFPIIPNRDSRLKLLTGNPGPTRMVAAMSKMAKQLMGQVSTTQARATLIQLIQMVLL